MNRTPAYVCPDCRRGSLAHSDSTLVCNDCASVFQIAKGCPILLRTDNLVFNAHTVADASKNGFTTGKTRFLSRLLPSPSYTRYATKAYYRALELAGGPDKSCLIVGSGDNAQQLEDLRSRFGVVVATDVSINAATSVVCDGHTLPFADSQFDFVILTAVLEHVIDPIRVVEEVGRVLKLNGVVFAPTPFMQQVHMGAYDYTRWTDLGYRWLFRNFEEVERCTCGGPGSTLAWAIIYFTAAFSSHKRGSRYLGLAARIAFFWIKYFDVYLERGARGYDGANGFCFTGRNKKTAQIQHHELLHLYRGMNR
jgi:SAM-dependent methyltransferase